MRARYGQTQQPELTVLKGVGLFAIARYRGAQVLGLPPGYPPPTPQDRVREVTREQSRQAYERLVSVGSR